MSLNIIVCFFFCALSFPRIFYSLCPKGGCPQGTVDSNAALKTCLVMAKGWPSRARLPHDDSVIKDFILAI